VPKMSVGGGDENLSFPRSSTGCCDCRGRTAALDLSPNVAQGDQLPSAWCMACHR
jgi:hypothetical protein